MPVVTSIQHAIPSSIQSSYKQHSFRPSRSPSTLLEQPSIIRTPQSMQQYRELDLDMQRHLDSAGAGPSKLPSSGIINSHSGFLSHDGTHQFRKKLSDVVQEHDPENGFIGREFQSILGTGNVHDKRCVAFYPRYINPNAPCPTSRDRSTHSDGEEANRPRKRPRFDTPYPPNSLTPRILEDGDLLGSWWGAVGTTSLLGNGIPPLPPPQRSLSSAASTSKAKLMKKK